MPTRTNNSGPLVPALRRARNTMQIYCSFSTYPYQSIRHRRFYFCA